jgi:N-acetylneuraminic acid mutarotase
MQLHGIFESNEEAYAQMIPVYLTIKKDIEKDSEQYVQICEEYIQENPVIVEWSTEVMIPDGEKERWRMTVQPLQVGKIYEAL